MKKISKFYNSKYFNIILFLIYFSLPFIIYYDLFINNKVPLSGDGIQFFSLKLFIKDAISSGEFPLWNPYLANGIPFAADLNGVFNPISLILSVLPIKWFIYSYYALHLAIGGFFTYLYLKVINCDKLVAICTGFIYIMSIHLGGYRKSHMSIICATILLPVILYFIEKYIKTLKIRYLLISSIVMGIQLLSGSIQYSLYTDIAIGVYLIFRLFNIKCQIGKAIKDIFLWGITYLGICSAQLLPAMELVNTYKQAGSGDISFEYFASYSINPIKIIMMLFPNMFGNDVLQPMGANNSSEMDIEIFLGVGVLMFILFAIIKYWKDKRIIISLIIMSGSFIYASCAHIPIINKMIYHLPVLGGFRCAGRILFLFIFFGYVIFAVSLTKLRENNNINELLKFILGIFTFICGVIIIEIPICYIMSSDNFNQKYATYKLAFLHPLLAMFIMMIFLKLLKLINDYRKVKLKYIYIFINIAMTLLTVMETSRFSFATEPTSIDDFRASSTVTKKIKSDIGNNKLWMANTVIDGAYHSAIEFNSNVSMEIPAINAYIAFNNPRLFRLFTNCNKNDITNNYSGLLSGFQNARQNLLLQNDLLSMLGIKYILDPQNLISENGESVESLSDSTVIYSKNKIEIPYMNGQMYVFSEPIDIEPNSYYKISFTADSKLDQKSFYADLYGGDSYDNFAQNVNFSIFKGRKSYYAYFNSEDSTVASDISFRFVSVPSSNIQITDIKVTKMNANIKTGTYLPYYSDTENRVYINTNAKNILYVPSSVEKIKDVDDIYNNISQYDLDDISYIENIENYKTSTTDIGNIKWKRNSISATISAKGKTFINFSQNYYPGWKAFVDGKETKVYMVNGLIQGIEVQVGDHEIKFKFAPDSVYIGASISLLTLIISVFIMIVERRCKRELKRKCK